MSSPKLFVPDAEPADWFKQNTNPVTIVPWYKHDIGPRLKPSTRALYRDYSGLKDDEIVDHLKAIVRLISIPLIYNKLTRLYQQRQRAWPLGEYPCIGRWLFLQSTISAFPNYQAILSRVKDSATVLDLGCSLGHELRRLAADGAPSDNMYAADLNAELWDVGYDLFRDRETMKARFIQADVLDPNTPLRDLKGKIDIVIACLFLHLFSWDQQFDVLLKIVEMSRPGTCLVGYHVGRDHAMELQRPWGLMYFHDVDSFNELWRQVARETGTRWVVDAMLVDLSQCGLEKEDYGWVSPGNRYPNFVVTRSEEGTEHSL